MHYRPELDGLRAVAVVPVVLFHAGLETFSGGYVGVDVFFVISGYLITSIVVEGRQAGTFSLSDFYARRFRRILPALFFVTLCSVVPAWFLLPPDAFKDFSQSIAAVAAFSSNGLFWLESGYFATDAELKPLLHTWSLAIEEQFYLLFPVILLTTWRFGLQAISWGLGAILIISLTAAHLGVEDFPQATFYLLPTRAWELLMGALVAVLLHQRPFPTLGSWTNNTLSGVGLLAVIWAIFAFDSTTPFPSLYGLVPTGGTVLIILFAKKGTFVHSLLTLRVSTGIGLISYSIYLWHQPLLVYDRLLSPELKTNRLMMLIALILLLAWATWALIEQPFRRRKRLGRVSSNKFLLATSISIFALGVTGHLTYDHLNPLRYSDEQLFLYRTAAASPLRESCHFSKGDDFPASDSCLLFEGEPRWAVFGNSHGVELAYAFAELLRPQGEALFQLTVDKCTPRAASDPDEFCEAFMTERLEFILQNEEIDNVLLAFRMDNAGPERARALGSMANQLARTGKDVVVVLQAPTLRRHISYYIMRSRLGSTGTVSARSEEEWRVINADIEEVVEAIDPEVQILDLAEVFCEDGTCDAIRDDLSLYYDDEHMSLEAARLAAQYILRHLNR